MLCIELLTSEKSATRKEHKKTKKTLRLIIQSINNMTNNAF